MGATCSSVLSSHTKVRSPRRAACNAIAAVTVDLPTPPLPVTRVNRRSKGEGGVARVVVESEDSVVFVETTSALSSQLSCPDHLSENSRWPKRVRPDLSVEMFTDGQTYIQAH